MRQLLVSSCPVVSQLAAFPQLAEAGAAHRAARSGVGVHRGSGMVHSMPQPPQCMMLSKS
jgi:hypothetical protein